MMRMLYRYIVQWLSFAVYRISTARVSDNVLHTGPGGCFRRSAALQSKFEPERAGISSTRGRRPLERLQAIYKLGGGYYYHYRS